MAEEDSAEATMYQAIGEQVEAMAASGAPSGAEPAETGEVPVAAAAASAAGAGEDGDDADSDDEGSNAKADAAARAAGIEVVPGTLCMSCQGTGTTKLLPTRIPFFREVIICAFLCDDCGFRSSEVMTSETQDKGCSFSLKVEGPEDLQRQMLKGDKATLRIPALDVEVPITTMRGVFTTLEGVLDTMASDLERQQPVRRAMDPAAADSIDAFIAKARLFQAGDPSVLPFVFELDDPSGNSFVENPKAPARDPRLTVQFYRRTREQNFFCGLNADSEAVLNGEGGASGEETAGAHTALLVGSSAVTTSTRDAVGGDTHKHIKAGATIAPGATDRSKATPGGIMAASLLEKEVQRFDTQCSNCGGTAQTRMCMTSIPHFKEALIMALVCPHCGYKDVEVKGGGAVPPMGTVHELRMSTETAVEDLRRDVLKSDTAGVEIPELELEMEPGSLGGMYTTVEGLLDTMRDRIVKANPLQHAVGDSASMAEAPRRFREFLDKMQRASRGELAVTVILKDPMANSWVYSPWDDSEGGEDGDALAATVGLRGAHLSKEAKATDAAEVAAAAAAAAGGTSGGATATTVAAADAKGASAAAVELPLSTSAAATGRDPRLTLRWYTRTEEEDIDLGIADMDVSAFPAADVDIGTVDAVAAMVDEDASAAAAAESAASTSICAATPEGAGGYLREIPFAKIKFKTAAMVVVFYDTQLADPAEVSRALQIAVAASRSVVGYEFYKCDTSSTANRQLADESKLRGGVYIFSRTVDDGIDEFRLPLEIPHLVRYLHLRGVVGNPDDVRLFTGLEDLASLWHPLSPDRQPAFVRFHEPWCAYCFKMKRVWEAAATFFKGRVAFVDVDCSAGNDHRKACDALGITHYPILRMFGAAHQDHINSSAWEGSGLPPGGSWAAEPLSSLPSGWKEYRADWNGSRSLAGYEWALHVHAQLLGLSKGFPLDSNATVLSVFGVKGNPPSVTLADYSSLPPSPRDQDAVALAAALGAAGMSESASVSTHGSAVVGAAADGEEEDEDWGAYGEDEGGSGTLLL